MPRTDEVGAEARDDEQNVDHEELAQEPELIGTFHRSGAGEAESDQHGDDGYDHEDEHLLQAGMDGAQEISEGDRREEIEFARVDPIQEEPLVLAGHARHAGNVTGVEREDEENRERDKLGFHDLLFLLSRRRCEVRSTGYSDRMAFCTTVTALVGAMTA